jgi:hypothetical protein
MAKKHHTPEQIIHRLRQAEVELATGQAVPQVCRKLGVTHTRSPTIAPEALRTSP